MIVRHCRKRKHAFKPIVRFVRINPIIFALFNLHCLTVWDWLPADVPQWWPGLDTAGHPEQAGQLRPGNQHQARCLYEDWVSSVLDRKHHTSSEITNWGGATLKRGLLIFVTEIDQTLQIHDPFTETKSSKSRFIWHVAVAKFDSLCSIVLTLGRPQ